MDIHVLKVNLKDLVHKVTSMHLFNGEKVMLKDIAFVYYQTSNEQQ